MSPPRRKLLPRLRALPGVVVRNWHISVPVLVLMVLAAPFIWFLIPTYEPLFADEYQPLKALKFFYTGGKEFHKWGPLTDFMLGPFYAVTLGYWYLTGQFQHPSIKFPYGFKDPIWQLTTLILEGRVLFLLFNAACTAALGRYLAIITRSRSVIFLTLLTMICANPVVASIYSDTKPDGPATSLAALALCQYIVIWQRGLNIERAVWFSFLATCSVTGKELCALIFVLPFAGMCLRHLWEQRELGLSLRRGCLAPAAGVLTGVLSYAVMNIVYAPRTWLARIEFWTTGPGKDSAVWGSGLRSGDMDLGRYAVSMFETFLNNVGPLGLILIAAAILGLLLKRPGGWVFLSLPFVSVVVLGLAPMGYVEDRFYIVATTAMAPMLALGLGALLGDRTEPRFAGLLNVVGLATSFWFGMIAWYFIDVHYSVNAERYAAVHIDKSTRITEGSTFDCVPGKCRLSWMGYNVDMRSLGHIIEDPVDRPEIILIARGRFLFIEDAARFPARAAMMRADSGFDITVWKNGFARMGYGTPEVYEVPLPRYMPFSWVPAVREWNHREALMVFRKPTAPDPHPEVPGPRH